MLDRIHSSPYVIVIEGDDDGNEGQRDSYARRGQVGEREPGMRGN